MLNTKISSLGGYVERREKKIDEIERRIETETRVLDFEKKR